MTLLGSGILKDSGKGIGVHLSVCVQPHGCAVYTCTRVQAQPAKAKQREAERAGPCFGLWSRLLLGRQPAAAPKDRASCLPHW